MPRLYYDMLIDLKFVVVENSKTIKSLVAVTVLEHGKSPHQFRDASRLVSGQRVGKVRKRVCLFDCE